jgi:hypothetical protein
MVRRRGGKAKEKAMKWIVELEPGVFLANAEGDPGRTLDAANAKVFDSHPRACIALLVDARKYRPFLAARVTLAPLTEETPNVL